jgi:hypothetical protein
MYVSVHAASTGDTRLGLLRVRYIPPPGDDPKTYGQVLEIQSVTCKAETGTFQLEFRLNNTRAIGVDFTAMGKEKSLQAALEDISYIRNVTVTFDNGATKMCSPTGQGTTSRITFITGPVSCPRMHVYGCVCMCMHVCLRTPTAPACCTRCKPFTTHCCNSPRR